jgi:hypothetical protein
MVVNGGPPNRCIVRVEANPQPSTWSGWRNSEHYANVTTRLEITRKRCDTPHEAGPEARHRTCAFHDVVECVTLVLGNGCASTPSDECHLDSCRTPFDTASG